MKIKTKEDRRERIKHRIRKRVQGTEARPRLTVFRSVAHMYVQVVDDMTGRTIASASTVEPTVKGSLKKEQRGGNVDPSASNRQCFAHRHSHLVRRLSPCCGVSSRGYARPPPGPARRKRQQSHDVERHVAEVEMGAAS